MKTLLALSGGVDSLATYYTLLDQNEEVECVFFDYGQLALKQEFRVILAHEIIPHIIKVDYRSITNLPLIGRAPEEDGGSELFGRNFWFLSLMIPLAKEIGAITLAFGFNKDYYQFDVSPTGPVMYADTGHSFLEIAAVMLELYGLEISVPLIDLQKHQNIQLLREYTCVPDTYSCYQSDPCGKCKGCLDVEIAMEILNGRKKKKSGVKSRVKGN